MSQMREALSAIGRIGELLGRDHFIYSCIIDALNQRMSTTIELSFSDPHIFDVFTMEFLLGCIRSGDYVDPRDVQMHLQPHKSNMANAPTPFACLPLSVKLSINFIHGVA